MFKDLANKFKFIVDLLCFIVVAIDQSLFSTKKIIGNSVTLLIDDAYEYQSATIVLMDENERILNKKPTTIGG